MKSASPGNLLESHVLKPHSRPKDSEFLGVDPAVGVSEPCGALPTQVRQPELAGRRQSGVVRTRLLSQAAWVQTPALPLTGCVSHSDDLTSLGLSFFISIIIVRYLAGA